MKILFFFKPSRKVTLAMDNTSETVDLWGQAHTILEGQAGRVNIYDGHLSSPSVGQAVHRSDGKTTLNLLKETNASRITITLDDGRKGLIQVAPRAQKRGFASGEHYWLPQDKATGRFKPEPGRRHRKIYVSSSSKAMSQAAIAAHATAAGAPTTESQVTGAWLVARPQYGGSESMAVTDAVRAYITDALWKSSEEPRSDWLLYERGYTYAPTFAQKKYWRGESEIHPIVIGAWGAGTRPNLGNVFAWTNFGPRFFLLRDLQLRIFYPKHGLGNIAENCRINSGTESNLSNMGQVTFKETAIYDIAPIVPPAGATNWDGSKDRVSGIYGSSSFGIMFDGCIADRNGWAEGYDYNRSVAFPYPPSDRNHGIYLNYDNLDIHIRDSLISRNASAGLQIRSGGQYERNLFVDNNYAVGLHSGSDMGYVGQFTNFIDNVNFGAGYKRVVSYQGTINGGFDITGKLTAMVGNVICHLANPDDPAEIDARRMLEDGVHRPDWDAKSPYNGKTIYAYNDTQVYKWDRTRKGYWKDERVEGVSQTVLDQTTIQRYAANVTGQAPGTIDGLVTYLRDTVENEISNVIRAGVSWTKSRFGSPLPVRNTPADLVFRPDPRTEGLRADNRLNWSTFDLPGMHVADTINLDGHDVMFGTLDRTIATMTSRGGRLDVTSGKLETGSLQDAANVTVRNSGQFWCGAMTQDLAVKAVSGRVRFTGAVSKLAMEAGGRAEVLFGPDATIPTGRKLVLSGQRVLAGWDGTGSATLTVVGTLEFRVGMTISISGGADYFQYMIIPGNKITTANFSASVADYEERSNSDTNRPLYLSDLSGMPVLAETFVYGYRSVVANHLDTYEEKTATVKTLGARGIPMLQRFRSGALGDGVTDPTIAASLVLAAGSAIVIDRTDLMVPGTYDLTGPGVTVTNKGATLPEGVAVTEGKLVLTVG